MKRISPLDDHLGILADEVIISEDEEAATGQGAAYPWYREVGGSLGYVP